MFHFAFLTPHNLTLLTLESHQDLTAKILGFSYGEEAVSYIMNTNIAIEKMIYPGYSSGMERTIVVRLETSSEQPQVLDRTMQEHTACFNTVARLGFETKCSNSVELHKETYYLLRSQYPKLPAQLVCAARVKAAEAVKSALSWERKHLIRFSKLVEKAKKLGKENTCI